LRHLKTSLTSKNSLKYFDTFKSDGAPISKTSKWTKMVLLYTVFVNQKCSAKKCLRDLKVFLSFYAFRPHKLTVLTRQKLVSNDVKTASKTASFVWLKCILTRFASQIASKYTTSIGLFRCSGSWLYILNPCWTFSNYFSSHPSKPTKAFSLYAGAMISIIDTDNHALLRLLSKLWIGHFVDEQKSKQNKNARTYPQLTVTKVHGLQCLYFQPILI